MKKVCVLILFILIVPLAIFLRPKKVVTAPSHNISMGEWNSFRGDEALSGKCESIADSYKIRWQYKVESAISSSPVMDLKRVVFTNEYGVVYALNRQNGELLWSFKSSNSIEAPALIFNESVYIGNLSGDFYCLDLFSGKEKWHFSTGEQIYGSANIVEVDSRKLVVFGSYDFFLHALDAQSGEEVWKVKTANYVNGTPAVDSTLNRIAFGGCDSKLRIVDYKIGKESGVFKAGSYLPSSPAIADSVAYVGSHNGVLNAVDINSAESLWTFKSSNKKAFIVAPAVSDDYVVCCDTKDSCFVLERASGKLLFRIKLRDGVKASPVISEKRILVADEAGWISIIDIDKQQLVWEYFIGPEITASPAIAGNELVICDQDGNVYMFTGEKE